MKYRLLGLVLFFGIGLYAQEGGATGPEEITMVDTFLSMLFSLGVIILLLLLAGWFLKRLLNTKMTQANVGSRIKIVERRSLAPKSNVYLLNVAGKGVLVGESVAGLHTLAELTLDEELISEPLEQKEASTGFNFRQLIQRKLKARS